MLRQKFFTGISIFGISFTIMVFSVIAGFTSLIFGNAAPSVNRDRTLYFGGFSIESNDPYRSFASPPKIFYEEMGKLPGVEAMALYHEGRLTSFHKGKKTVIEVAFNNEQLWRIYKHDLLEGRTFTAKESEQGQSVVVITEAVKKHFFGDKKAAGKYLETTPRLKVIGVVKDFLHIGGIGPEGVQAYIPLNRYRHKENTTPTYSAIILAKKRSNLPGIKDGLYKLIGERFNPTKKTVEVRADDVFERNDFGQYLALMTTFVFLTMVIPALNLIGINIGRIAERSSEIGIRKAFGASSSVLAGQFITESIIITLIGGIFGILLTFICSSIIIDRIIVSHHDISSASNSVLIHWDVILYALMASLFFGLLSGTVPAWRMSRLHAVDALKGGNL